jgi:competence ComEA-like helix-hairpin-helix protein
MNEHIRDFLSFTRRERSGVLLLLTLCLLGYGVPWLYPLFFAKPEADFTTFEKEAAALDAARKAPPATLPQALFPFDPNRASMEELQALGLPRATARTILKYRNRGGRFRRKSDLRKIYTLQEEDYLRLAPYIRLPSGEPATTVVPLKTTSQALFHFNPQTVSAQELQELGLSGKVARTFVHFREKGGTFEKPADLLKVYGMTPEDARRLTPYARFPKPPKPLPEDSLERQPPAIAPKPLRVDINRASAEDWQRLYGIGPVLSDRIIRFRDKLGGFSTVEQVRETYGLPDSTFENIYDQLELSPIFRPLAVNRLGWEELSGHPYLDRRQAQAIVAYRRQHGPFSSASDFDKVLVLPEELRGRLRPYWGFD